MSNFDQDDLEEAHRLDHHLTATDQVLYNLSRRGIEWNVLPWCRQHHIPVMAYSPIEQGRILKNLALVMIANQLKVTPAQVRSRGCCIKKNVIVIPKIESARSHSRKLCSVRHFIN